MAGNFIKTKQNLYTLVKDINFGNIVVLEIQSIFFHDNSTRKYNFQLDYFGVKSHSICSEECRKVKWDA